MLKFLFTFIFCGLACFPVMAAELTVTLYPDAGDVREELTLKPENGNVSIRLPRDVQPESVRLTVPGAVVHSLSIADEPAVDSPRTQAARTAVESAQDALAVLDAKLTVLATRIVLWQKPPVQLADQTALAGTDAAVAERLPVLLAEQRALLQQRLEAAQKVQHLQNVLRRVSGEPDNAARTTPLLVASLTSLSADAPLGANVSAVLEYRLGNCGWTPEYRLEAFTDAHKVRVSRLAMIRQSSGRDWANAALRLSTARPATYVAPMPVRDWRIVPAGEESRPSAMMAMGPMGSGAAPRAATLHEAADNAAPAYAEGASAMMWDMGTRSVNSGDDLMVNLDSQDWKADFYRLLRPGQQETAWLMAAVTPPAPQVLPEALTRLVVDGVSMGNTAFAFSGDKGDIALGMDPAVTVEMVLDSNQSGDRGIIAKSQTRVWSWRITASNAHAAPVTVRVEDPAPQAGDERIAVRVESTPAPKTEKNVLRWAFTLPANGKTDIAHKVSLSAPADMKIWVGR